MWSLFWGLRSFLLLDESYPNNTARNEKERSQTNQKPVSRPMECDFLIKKFSFRILSQSARSSSCQLSAIISNLGAFQFLHKIRGEQNSANAQAMIPEIFSKCYGGEFRSLKQSWIHHRSCLAQKECKHSVRQCHINSVTNWIHFHDKW